MGWNYIFCRLSFLMVLLCASSGQAQQDEFIFGQLIDSKTKEPVPFATVKLKAKPLGVISNRDGGFKIPIKYIEEGDVLEISCMGYESKAVAFSTLDMGQGNTIFLNPGVMQLNEAVVSAKMRRLTAREIVRNAVNGISRNYPMDGFGLVGYYRDFQIRNGRYQNLNEAIVKIMDNGFGTEDNFNSKYQLYSYKKNASFPIDSFAKQPYDYRGLNKVVPSATMENRGGNEFMTLIVHDIIRNHTKESFSFVDHLRTDYIQNHRFRLRGKTNYDNQVVYEIDCLYQDDFYLGAGKIFINQDNFAIHKFEYAVFKTRKTQTIGIAENEEERYSNGFTKSKNEILYRIQIAYAPGKNGKMFLNYISFYNKFLLKRPVPFQSKFYVDLEDRYFRIRLNKQPAKPEKVRKSDFLISYEGEKIPVDEFYFLEDERTFIVCPKLDNKRLQDTYDSLFARRRDLKISKDKLKYAYQDIRDDLGNLLDDQKLEYMHQYREFFTQEISPTNEQVVEDTGLMNKLAPLDSPAQPIYHGKLKREYWENTPLPTFKK